MGNPQDEPTTPSVDQVLGELGELSRQLQHRIKTCSATCKNGKPCKLKPCNGRELCRHHGRKAAQQAAPKPSTNYQEILEQMIQLHLSTGCQRSNWFCTAIGILIQHGWKIVPSVTLANGIVVPVDLGEWERQSMPLTVSDPYPELFGQFLNYFKGEEQAIGDSTLVQEEDVLKKLQGYRSTNLNLFGF